MEEEIKLEVAKNVDTKDIELALQTDKKVDEAVVEKSLNYDALTSEEKSAIDEFISKVDVRNTAQILQFGSSAQSNISKFSDSVLNDVRTKSSGEVGDLLSGLVTEIKEFNADVQVEEKKGILGIFNSAKKQVEKLIAKYDKVENNIAKIEKSLETHKLQMMKDIAIFDTMYDKNLQYFKELSLYIIAGEKKLEELKTVTLPELQKIAEETTRIISIQMAPQIRLIQNNDSELVEKIQSSLINTIPLWKNQIVIALGITNARNALGAQKQVTQMTNDMLTKNSELLKQGTIEIAEESEKAVVDVQTLQKTNQDIIDTLDKVIEIHENGRVKRQEAEVQLEEIENKLKEKLLEIKN